MFYNQSSQKRNTHALLMKSALFFFAPDFKEDHYGLKKTNY